MNWEIVGIFLKLPELAFKLCERPKITIEAKDFYYHNTNEPDGLLVVLTSCPSRYHARLAFSNIGRRLTTVRRITVLINKELELPASDFNQIRLEPGECGEEIIVFPVENNDALSQGVFEIQAVDAFGKKYKCRGQFPPTRDA